MTMPAYKTLRIEYYSDRMKDLGELLKKSGFTTMGEMLADAHAYYDVYREYEAMNMFMVTCPGDDLSLLKAVEDKISSEHMKVDVDELDIEISGWNVLEEMAGEEDVTAFMSRLLVIYEQIAEARFLKYRVGMIQERPDDNPLVGWIRVETVEPDSQKTARNQHKPMLN